MPPRSGTHARAAARPRPNARRQREQGVRIVGGEWRGRDIPVRAAEELRPTPNRVRETLFNWLAPRIEGARCIDLFAGSGALGLEALSRGAASVHFIDSDRELLDALGEAIARLGAAPRARLSHGDALAMAHAASSADIVFIDPPFKAALHGRALSAITASLTPSARVYLEYPAANREAVLATLDHGWQVLRDKRAGQVGYCLARRPAGGEDTSP